MNSKYLEIEEITALQIEVTSRCNLMCPQCGRVSKGKLNPLLTLSELTPDDYDKIFYEEKLPSLQEVFLNGNFGDPIISKHIDYLIEINLKKNLRLKIFTNGGLRSHSWWESLGKKFAKTKNEIVFAIDGLKDTNPIYRVNSNWDKIIENAEAYLKSGARARWDFLIFKHNEHQVEQAQALAKKMRFKTFIKKKTTRFTTYGKDSFFETKSEPIHNKNKKLKLEISSTQSENFKETVKNFGSFENYIDKTPIDCKYRNNKQLYIDFMGLVWPCCWLAYPLYTTKNKNPEKTQLQSLFSNYEKNFNSLRHHSLSQILSHDWFQKRLVKSWKNTSKEDNFKLFTCGKTCGKNYEHTNTPGSKNSITVPLSL